MVLWLVWPSLLAPALLGLDLTILGINRAAYSLERPIEPARIIFYTISGDAAFENSAGSCTSPPIRESSVRPLTSTISSKISRTAPRTKTVSSLRGGPVNGNRLLFGIVPPFIHDV
jgi:hypothetical protein